MMSNIASPWRYDAATFYARDALEHAAACDLTLRPWQQFSSVTVALEATAEPSPFSGETRNNYTPSEYFAV
jgi:hypothetical protein